MMYGWLVDRAMGMALAAAVVMGGTIAPAQSQAPATAPPAKELATLLQARKLESFAARVPDERGRFVAAFLIPGTQILVVSALHGRSTDMEYYLYKKDFQNAYVDLNSSAMATERVIVEDALGDGLVALPGKNLAHDGFVKDGARQTFDGLFADPRRRNDKRIPREAYMKAFDEAEQVYARLLGILIDELKKAG